jgi:hypothetical protein
MESPIFIFSLPRSGSTLLQRVLMSHPQVCSVAEPWLLLPQTYLLKNKGTLSDYSSLTANKALKDFIGNLPQKDKDYSDSLRQFILDLYSKQCKQGERYFLDKTPRYYLIVDEIVSLFPNAKFIFLFRNPLQAYASGINTWGKGRFKKYYSTRPDIILGTKLLSKGFFKHKDKSISINYEDFVSNTPKELEKISEYIEMNIDIDALAEFSKQDTKGSLGDPTGTKTYTQISSEGLEKWKTTFNSVVRKWHLRQLLNKIKEEDLNIQGYDKTQMVQEIKSLDNKKNYLLFKDLFDFARSSIVGRLKLHLFFNKEFSWIKNSYLS